MINRLQTRDREGAVTAGCYTRILILCGSMALSTAMGQPRLTFDVAAIKINTIGAATGTGLAFNGSRLQITNATLQYLIRTAYKIQGEQIAGGPAWLDDERYDVEASTGAQTPTPDQLRTMLQNLLEDRFGLKFHRETRQMTVNALVVEKSGARLKADTDAGGTSLSTDMDTGRAVLSGTRVSMEQLVGYISKQTRSRSSEQDGSDRCLRLYVHVGYRAGGGQHRSLDLHGPPRATGTPIGIDKEPG